MRINPVIAGRGRTYQSCITAFQQNSKSSENEKVQNNVRKDNSSIYYMPLGVGYKNKKQFSFTGITQYMPRIKMNCADDLIKQWGYLANSRYLEALDDALYPVNKSRRMENYSFLDNVPVSWKPAFIKYFKEFTSFPNLQKTSIKIEEEYAKNVKKACPSGVNVILAGYDPTCSVGLKKAFPGSDVDKAYVILNNNSGKTDAEIVNEFKANLWFNTDQRILSLNNENTFPEVHTTSQVTYLLSELDWLSDFLSREKYLKFAKNNSPKTLKNPIESGIYNIELANFIRAGYVNSNIDKETAKNAAYFIEPVQYGKHLIKTDGFNLISERINQSYFATRSNVTQMYTENQLLQSGEKKIKTKLQLRERLNEDFEQMPVETQFDFIKDIIKSVSKDNEDSRFTKYFVNDDNIKERFDKLNIILTY